MLYPHQIVPDQFIVMDYNQESIPLRASDVIVPIFPEKHDMIKVRGDEEDEIWLAWVHDVDQRSKTCRVHFYVQHTTYSNVYRKKHSRIETVNWNSIVGLSSGRLLDSDYYYADS